MNTHRLAVPGHQGPARVARVLRRVMFDHIVDGGPVRIAIGLFLGDDAPGERILGVAQRKARHIDLQPRLDLAIVPFQVGRALALHLDDGQV